jgi:hypothetical protein
MPPPLRNPLKPASPATACDSPPHPPSPTQADFLRSLFVALNDESVSVRELAIRLVGDGSVMGMGTGKGGGGGGHVIARRSELGRLQAESRAPRKVAQEVSVLKGPYSDAVHPAWSWQNASIHAAIHVRSELSSGRCLCLLLA